MISALAVVVLERIRFRSSTCRLRTDATLRNTPTNVWPCNHQIVIRHGDTTQGVMFSKDNLKRLAEQAQKAGNRLATNAGGTTNQWFAGQGSPEKTAGMLLTHRLANCM